MGREIIFFGDFLTPKICFFFVLKLKFFHLRNDRIDQTLARLANGRRRAASDAYVEVGPMPIERSPEEFRIESVGRLV